MEKNNKRKASSSPISQHRESSAVPLRLATRKQEGHDDSSTYLFDSYIKNNNNNNNNTADDASGGGAGEETVVDCGVGGSFTMVSRIMNSIFFGNRWVNCIVDSTISSQPPQGASEPGGGGGGGGIVVGSCGSGDSTSSSASNTASTTTTGAAGAAGAMQDRLLLSAIMSGNTTEVQRLMLLNDDAAVGNSLNTHDGCSLLHYAAAYGNTETAQWLLMHHPYGANCVMAQTTHSGDTPLHWAARQGRVPVARLLLDHGADILARNHVGQTPLAVADSVQTAMAMRLHQKKVAARSLQALLLATDLGNDDDCVVVDSLLNTVAENEDADEKKQTMTPISIASESENEDDTCFMTKAAAAASGSHQSRDVMIIPPKVTATTTTSEMAPSPSSSRDIVILETQNGKGQSYTKDMRENDDTAAHEDKSNSSSTRETCSSDASVDNGTNKLRELTCQPDEKQKTDLNALRTDFLVRQLEVPQQHLETLKQQHDDEQKACIDSLKGQHQTTLRTVQELALQQKQLEQQQCPDNEDVVEETKEQLHQVAILARKVELATRSSRKQVDLLVQEQTKVLFKHNQQTQAKIATLRLETRAGRQKMKSSVQQQYQSLQDAMQRQYQEHVVAVQTENVATRTKLEALVQEQDDRQSAIIETLRREQQATQAKFDKVVIAQHEEQQVANHLAALSAQNFATDQKLEALCQEHQATLVPRLDEQQAHVTALQDENKATREKIEALMHQLEQDTCSKQEGELHKGEIAALRDENTATHDQLERYIQQQEDRISELQLQTTALQHDNQATQEELVTIVQQQNDAMNDISKQQKADVAALRDENMSVRVDLMATLRDENLAVLEQLEALVEEQKSSSTSLQQQQTKQQAALENMRQEQEAMRAALDDMITQQPGVQQQAATLAALSNQNQAIHDKLEGLIRAHEEAMLPQIQQQQAKAAALEDANQDVRQKIESLILLQQATSEQHSKVHEDDIATLRDENTAQQSKLTSLIQRRQDRLEEQQCQELLELRNDNEATRDKLMALIAGQNDAMMALRNENQETLTEAKALCHETRAVRTALSSLQSENQSIRDDATALVQTETQAVKASVTALVEARSIAVQAELLALHDATRAGRAEVSAVHDETQAIQADLLALRDETLALKTDVSAQLEEMNGVLQADTVDLYADVTALVRDENQAVEANVTALREENQSVRSDLTSLIRSENQTIHEKLEKLVQEHSSTLLKEQNERQAAIETLRQEQEATLEKLGLVIAQQEEQAANVSTLSDQNNATRQNLERLLQEQRESLLSLFEDQQAHVRALQDEEKSTREQFEALMQLQQNTSEQLSEVRKVDIETLRGEQTVMQNTLENLLQEHRDRMDEYHVQLATVRSDNEIAREKVMVLIQDQNAVAEQSKRQLTALVRDENQAVCEKLEAFVHENAETLAQQVAVQQTKEVARLLVEITTTREELETFIELQKDEISDHRTDLMVLSDESKDMRETLETLVEREKEALVNQIEEQESRLAALMRDRALQVTSQLEGQIQLIAERLAAQSEQRRLQTNENFVKHAQLEEWALHESENLAQKFEQEQAKLVDIVRDGNAEIRALSRQHSDSLVNRIEREAKTVATLRDENVAARAQLEEWIMQKNESLVQQIQKQQELIAQLRAENNAGLEHLEVMVSAKLLQHDTKQQLDCVTLRAELEATREKLESSLEQEQNEAFRQSHEEHKLEMSAIVSGELIGHHAKIDALIQQQTESHKDSIAALELRHDATQQKVLELAQMQNELSERSRAEFISFQAAIGDEIHTALKNVDILMEEQKEQQKYHCDGSAATREKVDALVQQQTDQQATNTSIQEKLQLLAQQNQREQASLRKENQDLHKKLEALKLQLHQQHNVATPPETNEIRKVASPRDDDGVAAMRKELDAIKHQNASVLNQITCQHQLDLATIRDENKASLAKLEESIKQREEAQLQLAQQQQQQTDGINVTLEQAKELMQENVRKLHSELTEKFRELLRELEVQHQVSQPGQQPTVDSSESTLNVASWHDAQESATFPEAIQLLVNKKIDEQHSLYMVELRDRLLHQQQELMADLRENLIEQLNKATAALEGYIVHERNEDVTSRDRQLEETRRNLMQQYQEREREQETKIHHMISSLKFETANLHAIVSQHKGKDRELVDFMTKNSFPLAKQQEEVGDDDTTTEQAPQVTRTQELDRIRAKLAAIRNKTNGFNNSSITKKGSEVESYYKEKMDLGTTASTAKRVLHFGRQSSRTQDDGESESLPSV